MRPLSAWVRRRTGPLLVTAGLVLVSFHQASGRIVADTKLDLTQDPLGFLNSARDLWDPTAWFGFVPNQQAGYWFPMGPFFALGHALGVPAWIIQRTWMAALFVVAFWGVLRVLEALGVGGPTSRTVGALAYAVNPAVLLLIGHQSATLLPAVLLPWALLPLVHGSRYGSPRRAAALSAVAVVAMGGTNGAATMLVLAVPLLYLLTRRPGPRRRSLTGWWIALVPVVTVWWWGPLLLQGRYGFDFTAYTERADATTATSSLSEILRGASIWTARLTIRNRPWLPAGKLITTGELVVLASTLVAALGLAGLAHRRLRERRFLATVLGAGVVSMALGYGLRGGSPVSGVVRDLLDGPLAPLRNTYKLAPLVALPLAAGTAHALPLLADWSRRTTRRVAPRLARATTVLLVVAVAGVLLVAISPALRGRLPREGSFTEIPEYWQQAARWLEDHDDGSRTLILPASTFAEYTWGRTFDEPLQAISDTPWAVRNIVPLGSDTSTRLLDEIEDRLEDGSGSPALASVLARSGVGRVLVRNDLDLARSTASEPRYVRAALAASPGLRRVEAFGPVVRAPFTRERLTTRLTRPQPSIRAVEIWAVAEPAPPLSLLPADGALRVEGGPESTLTLAEAGVLDGRGLVLAADDRGDLDGPSQPVLTDDARRRDTEFGQVHDAESYTLAPGETTRGELHLRGLPEDAPLATADYLGLASVTASSYYTGFAKIPGAGPAAAFDGHVSSAWYPAGYQALDAQWLEVDLDEPTDVRRIRVRLPVVAPGRGQFTDFTVVTDQGEVPLHVDEGATEAAVDLPEGETGRVTVEVDAGTQTLTDLLPPGIAEIQLAGIRPQRVIRLPASGGGTGPTPLVSLHRQRADPLETTEFDEDVTIERVFRVDEPGTYRIHGRVVPDPSPELLDLARAVAWQGDDLETTASSVWGDVPAFAPPAATDGDPATSWLAGTTDGDPTLSLRLPEAGTFDRIEVAFPPRPVPAVRRLRLEGGGETRTVRLQHGAADFPPLDADEVAITFPSLERHGGGFEDLIGIAEVRLVPSGARSRAVARSTPVVLPCGEGPRIDVGGERVDTRVEGRVADLLALRPLRLSACDEVELDAGEVRLSAGAAAGVVVDGVVLEPVDSPAAGTFARSIRIDHWGREHRDLTVGAGPRSLLALGENFNPGWVARLDGDELAPVRVDGWRQAWVVPDGTEGRIAIDFLPGAWYDRALLLGALGVALVLVLAAVPGRSVPAPVGPRRFRSGLAVTVVSIAMVAAVGPLGLVAPALWLLRRRGLFPLVAGLSLAAAGFVAVTSLSGYADSAGLPGQGLAALAVSAALVGAFTAPDDEPPAGSTDRTGGSAGG